MTRQKLSYPDRDNLSILESQHEYLVLSLGELKARPDAAERQPEIQRLAAWVDKVAAQLDFHKNSCIAIQLSPELLADLNTSPETDRLLS